jgi:hypothetical protein
VQNRSGPGNLKERETICRNGCINIPGIGSLTRASIYLDNGNPVHALIVPVSRTALTSHLDSEPLHYLELLSSRSAIGLSLKKAK